MQTLHKLCLTSTVAALALGAPASGQCGGIDFEGYPVGTEITSQYDGVNFWCNPGSCGGPGSIRPVITAPSGGTSSGSRALGIQTGCPDFSPDYIVMGFDEVQPYVSFTMGEGVTPNIDIRVVGYAGDFSIIYDETVTCGSGVHRLVEIGERGGDPLVYRIVVVAEDAWFETIDDLTFALDTTPPTARIDSPVPSDCLCDDPSNPLDRITISGIACDEDGEYGSDRLEYRRAGTDDPWTLIQSFTTPLCTAGPAYTWNLQDVPHGRYYLRQTVENACGLVSTDVVYVLVDKDFGEAEVTSPASGETVCGVVDIVGSMNDACRQCFTSYTVNFASSPLGPFAPVDPAHPSYDEAVMHGTLATWDTAHLPNGPYFFRATGVDECGNVGSDSFILNVDHDACCDADIDLSGAVDFGDLLSVLSNWGPCPE